MKQSIFKKHSQHTNAMKMKKNVKQVGYPPPHPPSAAIYACLITTWLFNIPSFYLKRNATDSEM